MQATARRPAEDSVPASRSITPPVWVQAIPDAFWWMLGISIVLDLIAFGTGYITAHLNHADLTTIVIPRLHRHSDLMGFVDRIGDYGTSEFFSQKIRTSLFNYPALMAWPMHWLFARHTPLQRYSGSFMVFLLFFIAVATRIVHRVGVPVLAALLFVLMLLAANFPLHLLYFMNNMELFVWAVVVLGIVCYCAGWQSVAAVCFGVGCALKYYPVAFLGVFPLRRGWPHIVLGLASALTANLLGLWLMGPTIVQAYHGLQASGLVFTQEYLHKWHIVDSVYDHSLFGLLKLIMLGIHQQAIPAMLPWYLGIAGPLALILWLVRIQHLRVEQRLLALSVLAVWLMPISQDYTLVALLLPTLLILRASSGLPRRAEHTPLLVGMVSLGFIFGALTFVRVGIIRYQEGNLVGYEGVGIGGYIRALLLGVVLVCSLRDDFLPAVESRRGADRAEVPLPTAGS